MKTGGSELIVGGGSRRGRQIVEDVRVGSGENNVKLRVVDRKRRRRENGAGKA